MLRGGLEAMRAREEALRTAQTLDADLARKRTRAEQLQATNHPKAVRPAALPLLCVRVIPCGSCGGSL